MADNSEWATGDIYAPGVSWTLVLTSSNVGGIGYDTEKETLFVRFHSGGIYAWYDIPNDFYQDFLNAPSKGKFVHWELEAGYGKGQRIN